MKPIVLLVFLCLFVPMSAGATPVDPTTLDGKVMCGYQGWFTAAGDDNPFSLWIHWAINHANPDGSNLRVEMYPDVSEFDASELSATAMTKDGGPAYLYSGRAPKTVNRHVRWMKEYGIDGVFAQRFLQTLHQDAAYTAHFTAVVTSLLQSCGDYGRVMAVMYDVSGAGESWFWDEMRSDWMDLVDSGVVTHSRYLRHNGKPVVGIWGFGFKDGVHPPADPADAQAVIDWFQTNAPAEYQATVYGGVPGYWRTLNGDSRTDSGWADVYRSFDVLSPWTVGRYTDGAGADAWKSSRLDPDLTETQSQEIDYSPVIWPGFSWHNLTGGPTNQIPRNGGNFYWRQAYNAVTAGVDMVYVAMFDEVDEATAIYKTAPTADDTPDQGYWLTLDADGYSLPSDWYLRLTFEVGRMLRHEAPVAPTMPTLPGPHYTEHGTPIAWLDLHGLITNGGFESADMSDTDNDNMLAWEEYVAATIPTNALSVFNVSGIEAEPSATGVVISWHADTGRVYSVYTSTNLLAGITNHSGFSNVDGVPGVMSYTNVSALFAPAFHRVGVRLKQ